MLDFLLVPLIGPDGQVACDEETGAIEQIQIGTFADLESAINFACRNFNSRHLHHGVLTQNAEAGGYIVISALELSDYDH